MKNRITYSQLREKLADNKKMKVGNVSVEIKKQGNKFVVFVDGDKLDTFKSMEAAETGAKNYLDLIKRGQS